MKRFVAATGLALLAAAALLAWPSPLGPAAAGTLLAAALLTAATAASRRTSAALRLDWFVRMLRAEKQGQSAEFGMLRRAAQRLLPRGLFSNRATKQRGAARRLLRRAGGSWLASPIRRLVQAFCLTAFLLLLFYVCWPYGARPAPPALASSPWRFETIDSESGDLDFALDSGEAPAGLTAEHPVHLAAAVGEPRPYIVVSAADNRLRLRPVGELDGEQLDQLLTAEGDWTVYQSDPEAWPSHYADHRAAREPVPAETFLLIDPLVSLSTAIASRSWVWSLTSAGAILLVCVLIPRGFCGYLCPLGTTIDLFDWAVAGRVERFRVPDGGWWVHIKYYLLAGILICAVMGVLVSGVFAAIPVVTRGMLFAVDPLQSGALRGWHLVPAMNAGHVLSLSLFFLVLALGFLRPRFWCKYVCPSGAVFSIGNLFRATERKVESTCINCNKCVEICPFDAIKPDFTTRTTDCTMCQSCAGVCPTEAIKFVERWNVVDLKEENDPPTQETALGRRGFMSLAAGGAAAVAGGIGVAVGTRAFGANLDDPDAIRPVRPPGSVPEQEFLQMCIRCGECFKVCPNNVLQAEGFEQGLEGLWAPLVKADWAGCESSCNNCGHVCPTGAIRALPLEEKKAARMGLAIVNQQTCLPLAASEECDLCVQECDAAGYHAIEFRQVHTQVDDQGEPIEGSGFLAPVVLAEACVGCGLCQTRCYGINVKERGVLDKSAIVIEAGEGREDRVMEGSYIELRRQEEERRARQRQGGAGDGGFFVPDTDPSLDNPFGAPPPPQEPPDDNPFGAP